MHLELWPIFDVLELLAGVFERPDNSKEYLQAYREGSLAEFARSTRGFPQFNACYALERTAASPEERGLLSVEYAGMLKAIEEAGFGVFDKVRPFLADALQAENFGMYYLLLEHFPRCDTHFSFSSSDQSVARLAYGCRATVGPLLLARYGREGLCARDAHFFRQILPNTLALPILTLFHARPALHLTLPLELEQLIFRLLARLIQEAFPPLPARPADGAQAS